MQINVDKAPIESTRIIFLLDRSTSMRTMREEAVAGFNQYVATQKKVDGVARMSLFFFDSSYKPVYENVDIKNVEEIRLVSREEETAIIRGTLTEENLMYRPQGMTALYDYIHTTIMKFKDTSKPNEKTIFAILTDGEDTSSQFHTYHTVQAAMKEVQEAHGWEVLFLGANMNAKSFAQSVGIKLSNVAQFDASSKGISDAINTMAFASSYYRGDASTMRAATKAGATRSRGVGGSAAACADIDMEAALNAVASGKLNIDDDPAD